MSQEDSDRAVKDAEKFAEEDRKQKEAVDTKNHAENMIFQTEKTLGELGDKVTDDEKAPVNAAIEKLKETVKSGDTEAIKADTEAVEKAFYKVSEKLYAQQAQGQGFDPNNMGGQNGGAQDGQFYDANYEDNSNK